MKMRSPYPVLAAAMLFGAGCDKVKTLAGDLAKKQLAPKSAKPNGEWIRDLTMMEFKTFVEQPDVLAVIDYHADWCGPCKQLSPILEKLIAEKKGVVVLGRIDVDQAGAMIATQKVSAIPDVRLYRNGELVDRFNGLIPESEIRAKLDAHSKDLKPPDLVAEKAEVSPAKAAEPSIQPMKKDWRPQGIERR